MLWYKPGSLSWTWFFTPQNVIVRKDTGASIKVAVLDVTDGQWMTGALNQVLLGLANCSGNQVAHACQANRIRTSLWYANAEQTA